jgi:hypothetical protein
MRLGKEEWAWNIVSFTNRTKRNRNTLLLQKLFHRGEQFLNIFHLDLAHVRDAEGGFF